MSKTTQTTSSGVSGLTLLTIAFVVLKLCGVIDWSWWWVTAPTWIPLGIVAAGLLVVWGLLLVLKLVEKWQVARLRREVARGEELRAKLAKLKQP